MPLPDWVPLQIVPFFQSFEGASINVSMREIAKRLATDDRMQAVWNELLKKNRKSGKYFHPSLYSKDSSAATDDERQFAAIRDLLWIAICAARDHLAVSKPQDIEILETSFQLRSDWLRALALDLESIIAKGQLGIVDSAKEISHEHLVALRHVADWLDSLTGKLRKQNDPLMISKSRGDPLVRAVQILLAHVCETSHFGERLDGIMTTIASIAVGVPASKRASRSALSPEKKANKAQTSKP